MRKNLPNFCTSLNLLSGCIAIVMAFHGLYFSALSWIIIAAIFDFSDGFIARMLNAYSSLGKELDSLADMVSFGVAPSVIVFRFLSQHIELISDNHIVVQYLPYIGFIIAIFSGLRLAKFNIDERQSDSFIGLNVPANALFWSSLISCLAGMNKIPHIVGTLPALSTSFLYILLVSVVVFSILLVSEIPMFSLKVKTWKPKGNGLRYFLVLFIIIMVIFFGALGITSGILLYIALSLFDKQKKAMREKNNITF